MESTKFDGLVQAMENEDKEKVQALLKESPGELGVLLLDKLWHLGVYVGDYYTVAMLCIESPNYPSKVSMGLMRHLLVKRLNWRCF